MWSMLKYSAKYNCGKGATPWCSRWPLADMRHRWSVRSRFARLLSHSGNRNLSTNWSFHHHPWSPEEARSCIHHMGIHQGRQGEVAAIQGRDQSEIIQYSKILVEVEEEEDGWWLTCSSSESSSTGNSEHWNKETCQREKESKKTNKCLAYDEKLRKYILSPPENTW